MDQTELERGGDMQEQAHHQHRHHKIHFTVDGEQVEVLSNSHEETELTVREVLDDSGNKPPSEFQLVEFIGEGHKERKEFKDLDERIVVKNHARFAAICLKPTPVS